MTSSCKITALAVLSAYALFCFSVPPSTSATPSLRGGIPSLYMKVAVGETLGVRGAAAAAAPTGSHEVGKADPHGAIFVLDQLESVLVGMMVLADRLLLSLAAFLSVIAITLKWPMRVAAAGSSIFVIYRMFSASAVAEIDMAKFDQDDESFYARTVFETLAVLVSIMALSLRIPRSRYPTHMTITISAIFIAYALFSFGVPPSMSATPHLRGAIPSLYVKPVLSANSGLRGAVVSSTLNGMDTVEQDEAYDESYQSLPDLGVTLSESFGPMGYWVALSVPAIAMTYLTRRKEHSKLH